MSAGFGWSLSDVVLLTKVTRNVIKALSNERGARAQYHKVIRSLIALETTLREVHAILQVADPVFRNAVHGQLDLSTSSIRDFYDSLVSKYAGILCEDIHGHSFSRFRKKIHWAFSAAEEVCQFRTHLSEQLENVKLLMVTHIWFIFLYRVVDPVADRTVGRRWQNQRKRLTLVMLLFLRPLVLLSQTQMNSEPSLTSYGHW